MSSAVCTLLSWASEAGNGPAFVFLLSLFVVRWPTLHSYPRGKLLQLYLHPPHTEQGSTFSIHDSMK